MRTSDFGPEFADSCSRFTQYSNYDNFSLIVNYLLQNATEMLYASKLNSVKWFIKNDNNVKNSLTTVQVIEFSHAKNFNYL